MNHADVDFYPVIITARPTSGDYAPADFDPAAVRIARAADVQPGDLVLGYFPILRSLAFADYHADAYPAAPVPHDPGCGCPGHEALTADEAARPLAVLTDGFPWDVCDVMPADAPVLIVPAEPLPAAPMRTEPVATVTLNVPGALLAALDDRGLESSDDEAYRSLGAALAAAPHRRVGRHGVTATARLTREQAGDLYDLADLYVGTIDDGPAVTRAARLVLGRLEEAGVTAPTTTGADVRATRTPAPQTVQPVEAQEEEAALAGEITAVLTATGSTPAERDDTGTVTSTGFRVRDSRRHAVVSVEHAAASEEPPQEMDDWNAWAAALDARDALETTRLLDAYNTALTDAGWSVHPMTDSNGRTGRLRVTRP